MPDIDSIPYVRLLRSPGFPDDVEDIPIFGDVWRTQNAIVDFWEYGCFPSWQVWVETALKPIGELVVAVLSFGAGDVVRGYFRPTSIRSLSGFSRLSRARTGKTANAAARTGTKLAIPELGNLIGKNLPGAAMFRGRTVGKLERTLWQVDGIAQRGLWYWLIADITADFIVHWTSAIMNSEACSGPGNGSEFFWCAQNGVLSANSWWPWVVQDPDISDPIGELPDTRYTMPPGGGTLSFGASSRQYFGPYVAPSYRLHDLDTDEILDETTADEEDEDGNMRATLWTRGTPGHQIRMEYKVPPGVLVGEVNAFQSFTRN
jgi:hypothetical protein